jgi:alpha-tubulin suppressor-like RCC1 family protein
MLLVAVGCRENTNPITESTPPDRQPAVAAATALAFYQLSGGQDQYTCGVTPDNRAYCWGWNDHGQLGDGTTGTARLKPAPVATTLRFRQVSAGRSHTCAVTPDYRAYCWGSNGIGALGDGTTNDHYTPVAVAGGRQFRQVDAGTDFTCGVSYPDNRAFCWGNNWTGQLGNGTTTPHPRPVAVVGGLYFKEVRTGAFHACGVTTTNRAYCWGYNVGGRLGDSTAVTRLRPTRVAAGARLFRQVDAGGDHTCAVTTTYRAFCWGNGRGGALGNGKSYVSYWPRAVAGGLSFARVTTGYGHTCAETTVKRAYCWGWNDRGQLGDGTTTNRLTPVAVAGGLSFAQVNAGAQHTCGKTPADVAYCWGYNLLGALGDGTWQNIRTVPGPVAGAM